MSANDIAKLRRGRVVIFYGAADGFSSEATYKNQPGNPQGGLLAGLDELTRLLCLFGFEAEAEQAFQDARQRVADWKKANNVS